jgi:hypothetical protein
MAYEEGLQAITRPAGQDFSVAATNAYKGVKYNASGQLVAFAATTDRPAGVLQAPLPKFVGDSSRLGVNGVSKVRLGATVAAGDEIAFSATGLGQVAVTTQYIIGVAQSAGVSGDVIPVFIAAANPPKK